MKRKVKNELFIAIIAVLIVVPVFFVVSKIVPEPEFLGIQGIYSTVTEFNPFTEMSLVKSKDIVCSGTDSVYATSNTDNKRSIYKVGFEDEIIPSYSLNVLSTGGTVLKLIDGEVKIKCNKSTNTLINPQFAGGYLFVVIYATDSDGKSVKIKEQNLAVSSTLVDADEKTITIAKWQLDPKELESKLSKTPANFKTSITVNVIGTLKFKSFPTETKTWEYTIKDGFEFASAMTLKISRGPDTNIFENIDISGRKVELKLISPAKGEVNIASNDRIMLVGSLYDYEEKEGNPIVRMYYTDENANPSEKITPVYQKELTERKGTLGKGGVSDFAISILPGKGAKLGEYTIKFSSAEQNGSPIRKTVGTMAVLVVNKPVVTSTENPKTCESGFSLVGNECVKDDVTGTDAGKDQIKQVCAELAITEKNTQSYNSVINSLASGQAKDLLLKAVQNNGIVDVCSLGGSINDTVKTLQGLIVPVFVAIIFIIILVAIGKSLTKPKYPRPPYGYQ